ncbi:hypothetical protein Mpsy_1984 [Methanolobus psychrophilus R15]|nr:hypothetical protein Mpsy_1984 [Methanolobus psychrophilus R15]
MLIFIFQGDKIINYPLRILLIAIPLMLHLVSIMKRNKAKFQFGTRA